MMKNVKLNDDGTISYQKDGVDYTTVQTIHELAGDRKVIIKAKRLNMKQLGNGIGIIQG